MLLDIGRIAEIDMLKWGIALRVVCLSPKPRLGSRFAWGGWINIVWIIFWGIQDGRGLVKTT